VKPDLFRIICKNAAEKTYYPQCLQYIEMSLPVEFHDLAKSTLIYLLPSNILDLKTREDRREAIESIPDDAYPAFAKDIVKLGVTTIWNKEKKAAQNGKTSLRNRG
jgi:hypothetical protein|tara:strand:- start:778 stop:1095 length:318 start_codon:yes stop_codon:yes gene_type:complete